MSEFLVLNIKGEKAITRQKGHQCRIMERLSRNLLYLGIIKPGYMTKRFIGTQAAEDGGLDKCHRPQNIAEDARPMKFYIKCPGPVTWMGARATHTLLSPQPYEMHDA